MSEHIFKYFPGHVKYSKYWTVVADCDKYWNLTLTFPLIIKII